MQLNPLAFNNFFFLYLDNPGQNGSDSSSHVHWRNRKGKKGERGTEPRLKTQTGREKISSHWIYSQQLFHLNPTSVTWVGLVRHPAEMSGDILLGLWKIIERKRKKKIMEISGCSAVFSHGGSRGDTSQWSGRRGESANVCSYGYTPTG